ncbi:hypothetical protein Trydic_g7140 [Trypoxylus dichotomus]
MQLNLIASKTLQMIKTAYGDGALWSAQVFRWHKASKDGYETIEVKHSSGQSSMSKTDECVARVGYVLAQDRLLTLGVNDE